MKAKRNQVDCGGQAPSGHRGMTAGRFAARAGISVRTLHHYDRVALLRPGRSGSGYRLYREADFARLQQIVTLKFVGLSLAQIRDVLGHGRVKPGALRPQRRLLEAKRDQINAAITALLRIESRLAVAGSAPSQAELCEILEMIAMHNSTEWEQLHARYFTEEQRADMARRADPELAAQGTHKWTELIAEVEAAVSDGENPDSARARGLAARWDGLFQEFLKWAAAPGGKLKAGEVKGAISKMYAERATWPAGLKPPFSEAAWQFIQAARIAAAMHPPATDPAGEPVNLGKYGEFEIYPMPMFATIAVQDLAALRDWYLGALGFAVVFQSPQMVHLRRKKYQDLLLVGKSEPPSGAPSGNLTISFQTDDVDALAERVRNASPAVVVIEGPVDTPWNSRDLRVTDPVGTRLIFTAHNPNADPERKEAMRRLLQAAQPKEGASPVKTAPPRT